MNFGRTAKSLVFILAVLAAGLISESASANDWDGNGLNPPSGNFNVAANWSPNQVPTSSIPAVFNLDSSYTVTFTANAASSELQVLDGIVNFLSNNGTVRTYAISTGAADATVSGGELYVGFNGFPVFLNLGNTTSSTLTIGDVTEGYMNVSGTGSRLDALGNSDQRIGVNGGYGFLLVNNNATANLATQGGTVRLGDENNDETIGELWATAGGKINIGNLSVVVDRIGIPVVHVDGPESSITQTLAGASVTLDTHNGFFSTSIVVQNGGTFTSGTGDISVNGGATITNDGGTFNANGPILLNYGSFYLNSGIVVAKETITEGFSGSFFFDGGTLIADSFVGSLRNFGGTLEPGADTNIGTLLVDHEYYQSDDGELLIELGATVDSYDRLHATALATLGGKLTVVAGGYAPQADDEFEIIRADSIREGEFLFTELPELDNGLFWHIDYGPTTVTLKVLGQVIATPGDYNDDGVVDAADYVVWRKFLNSPGVDLPNEGASEGSVASDDYDVWRANYGAGSGGHGSDAVVPEPCLAIMVQSGLLLFGVVTSRRSRRMVID